MSKKTYLIKKTINSILKIIDGLNDEQVIIPNDIELTKSLNISRTTVRVAVEHLCDAGIIKRDGPHKIVLQKPTAKDYFDIENSNSTKDVQIEKYFLNLIHTGKLLPGDKFSELSLAKSSGCTTITVREFLIKFSNNGLIEKNPRGRWKMVKFDEDFAHELISFRQMVEMQALTQLLTFPKDHIVWQQLQHLLAKHEEISADMENRYREFPDIDRELHYIIQKSTKNRFTNQFFDIVSFVCHYHYQWDKTGELERFTVAIHEHIDLLKNLISHNTAGAIMSLEKHLDSAEETLLRCVHGLRN